MFEYIPEWHGLDIIWMEGWGKHHADDRVVQAPLPGVLGVHTPGEPRVRGAGEG